MLKPKNKRSDDHRSEISCICLCFALHFYLWIQNYFSMEKGLELKTEYKK